MRKKIILITTVVLTLMTAKLFAQEQSPLPKDLEIKSRVTEIDPETQNLIMYDVTLNSDKLKFEHAEQVEFNLETQTIKIRKCKDFTFDGKIVKKTNTDGMHHIEYRFGDDTIYIY